MAIAYVTSSFRVCNLKRAATNRFFCKKSLASGHHKYKHVYRRLRITATVRATKRATEMDLIEGSWNRGISRFAVASPDRPHVFRFCKEVQRGHALLNGKNMTGLMCTSGCDGGFYRGLRSVHVCVCVCVHVCVCVVVQAFRMYDSTVTCIVACVHPCNALQHTLQHAMQHTLQHTVAHA